MNVKEKHKSFKRLFNLIHQEKQRNKIENQTYLHSFSKYFLNGLQSWAKDAQGSTFPMTRKNYVNTKEAEEKKVYQLKCRLIATFVSHGLDIL